MKAKNHADFEYYYLTEHTSDTTPLSDEELAAMGISITNFLVIS